MQTNLCQLIVIGTIISGEDSRYTQQLKFM